MKQEENIKNILKEQMSGYKSLLELLQKERICLVDLNAECIDEVSKAKDTLIFKLRLLETERIRLIKEFAGEQVSLQKLSEMAGDATFLDIRSKLISLLQSIEEMNEFNRVLIDRSLNYIINNANFFGLLGINSGRPSKGSLLSGEI